MTLVEVVIGLSIAGIALMAILGGMMTVIRQSRNGVDGAIVESVLSGAADHLTTAAYVPCPEQDTSDLYLHSAQAAAVENGWAPGAVTIADIDYWNPTSTATNKWGDSNTLTGVGCNPAVLLTTSRGLQRITIQVTDPSTSKSRTIEVVKSDVAQNPTP